MGKIVVLCFIQVIERDPAKSVVFRRGPCNHPPAKPGDYLVYSPSSLCVWNCGAVMNLMSKMMYSAKQTHSKCTVSGVRVKSAGIHGFGMIFAHSLTPLPTN
jgi:hypothetical protein